MSEDGHGVSKWRPSDGSEGIFVGRTPCRAPLTACFLKVGGDRPHAGKRRRGFRIEVP